VLGIENFEEYKFYNPKKGTPMVRVGNVVDLRGVKVSIEELDNIEEVEIGERYVLIKSSSVIRGIEHVNIVPTQKMLARYDYAQEDNGELVIGVGEDNELRVMVKNIEVNTKSKEITEARVGSMIFVGEGISREIEKEIQGEKGSRNVHRVSPLFRPVNGPGN
jgi:hypothetical protein